MTNEKEIWEVIHELSKNIRDNEISLTKIETQIRLISKSIIIIPTVISIITFIGNYLDWLMKL